LFLVLNGEAFHPLHFFQGKKGSVTAHLGLEVSTDLPRDRDTVTPHVLSSVAPDLSLTPQPLRALTAAITWIGH
jgi:hypothetical protein